MSVPPERTTRTAPTAAEVADPGEGRGPLWLDAFLAVRMPEILTWRRHLHAHPEISNAEFATTAYLRRQLGRSGVDSRILPTGTGLVCEVGPDRPGGADGGAARRHRRAAAAGGVRPAVRLDGARRQPRLRARRAPDGAARRDAGAAVRARAAGPHPGDLPACRGDPARRRVRRGGQRRGRAGSNASSPCTAIRGCRSARSGSGVGAITSTIDLIELKLTGSGGHTARPHLTVDLVYALGTVITGLPGTAEPPDGPAQRADPGLGRGPGRRGARTRSRGRACCAAPCGSCSASPGTSPRR